MYIFLDESYNLRDRTKLQFISINGFKVLDTKQIRKRWKTTRLPFVTTARIHATDLRFELLRQKCFYLIARQPEITLLSVMQEISMIPKDRAHGYYRNDELNFDKVYEDMLKSLLMEVGLYAYKEVILTLDSREVSGGRLAKQQMIESLKAFVEAYTPTTLFQVEFQLSHSNTMLEMADFISNSFYKQYSGQRVPGLEPLLSSKTIAIKNPLR